MVLTLKEWHRQPFAVYLFAHAGQPRRAEVVSGMVCGPFGIYPGSFYQTGHSTTGPKEWTLVHMPSQIAHFTLPRERLCREAAVDLAGCDIAWESAWAPGLTGPGLEDLKAAFRRWKSYGVRKRWGER